ncbi:MAG: DUF2007 domain-containing protein [Deltaproteobacteria bacterium]|jgi:putative signal transducing protein
MKKVYSAKDPLMVAHLKNVLAMFGVHCVTRNLDLSSAAGELPPIECWPEIWITNDEKLARAKSIIKKTLAPLESVKKPWRCVGCGEELEGQFTECWNCGRSRLRSENKLDRLTALSKSVRNR